MSLVSRHGRTCPNCLRPARSVFGSAQWHARNDPPGGYCHCDSGALPGLPVPAPDEAPADAVTCLACAGRKTIGIPGAPCPVCEGRGWDKLATEAQRQRDTDVDAP